MKRMKKCVDQESGKGDQEFLNKRSVSVEWSGREGELDFQEDAYRFTQIIPEEVWLLILGILKKDDLTNCVNSSPFFWKMKKKNRTLDLFHKVVGIMTSMSEESKFSSEFDDYERNTLKLPNKNMKLRMAQEVESADEDDEFSSDEDDVDEEEEAVIDETWMHLVLKCRLVCVTWSKAVEECYEKPEMTGIPEFVGELDPRSPLNTISTKWTNETICYMTTANHPKTFLERFEKSHGAGFGTQTKNPFIGRKLSIRITQANDLEEREREYSALKKMLRLFGDQIWYCTLTGVFRFLTPAQVASKLQEVLTLLPNLKYLSFNGNSAGFLPLYMFAQSPLPKMEKLEVLHLEWLDSQIATQLISSNNHVAFLSILNSEVDSEVGGLLNNLKGYSTRCSRGGDEMLSRFGNDWKIDSLEIEQQTKVGAEQLFKTLHNYWADALTNVYLEDPFSRDENSTLTKSKVLRLKLPNVVRLSIRSFFVFFMDFALPLNKTLEHLEIYVHARWIKGHRDYDKVRREQTIELVGFKEHMHLSNIWNYFPNLKTIEFVYVKPAVRDQVFLHTKEGEKLVYIVNR